MIIGTVGTYITYLSHLQFFKMGEIMVSKYGNLMLPGRMADQVTSDINFTDEAIVQCDVTVVKILLNALAIYKWLQINFDRNTYVATVSGPSFIYSFSFLKTLKHII